MKLTIIGKTRQYLQGKLTLAIESGNLRLSQRIQCIRLISLNLPLEEIASLFNKTERTIQNWFKLYLSKGYDGLKYKRPSGRRGQLKKKEKQQLKELILKGPEENGYKSGVWTAAMIQELIFNHFEVSYKVGYIPQLLRGIGLSHKKVQTVCYKADKEKQRQWVEERLPNLMRKAIREGAKILWQDEVTFQIHVDNGYSWGERGKLLESAISLERTKQKVYGVIELLSGQLTYSFSKKKYADGDEFLGYLKYLLTRYKGTKIYVIIDNGPIHQGAQITRFLEAHREHIELERLPTYSPKFNPIEKLWKKMKNKSFHNRYFKDKKMLLKTLRNCLKYYQENADLITSVMKKWRQMYQAIEKTMIKGT